MKLTHLILDALRLGLRSRRVGCALALALVLAACGGGVGTGGTGTYTYGPITGFGSIIVGGVRFDDSVARVEDDDGTARSRGELKLGMTVGIDSDAITASTLGAAATAAAVRFGSLLVGPIGSVDATGFTSSLGPRVVVTATTVYGESLGASHVLTPGRVVEVHGFFDAATQTITATRIEASANPGTFKVRGAISQLNASAGTFNIGQAAYTLGAGATLPASASNGTVVTLRVVTNQTAGRWVVVRSSNPPREGRPDGSRDQCSIRGLVQSLTSSARFTLHGLTVDASAASFPDGTAGVVAGARVKVEGRCDRDTLTASKVEIESDDRLRGEGVDLRGVIESIDRTNSTLRVRGVTIFFGGSNVRFENGTAADLAVGRQVRVRGVIGSDRARVDAQRIEFTG